MSLPSQSVLPGDEVSSDQLVLEVLACFQTSIDMNTPIKSNEKTHQEHAQGEKPVEKKPKNSQKAWSRNDELDTVLSTEMIDELKRLREQQRSPAKQRYIGVAKTSK